MAEHKKKVLILFAHPRLENSRNHNMLLKHIPKTDSITIVDLYEQYPEFNIDVTKEKELLLQHDIIIWQHPFYWYSIPPLLKQWIDMVLEFGWAYGPGGTALKGKTVFNVITTGGQREVYSPDGRNRHTMLQFLAPLSQTATLCGLDFYPPFVIHGTHKHTFESLQEQCEQYYMILEQALQESMPKGEVAKFEYLNDWWLWKKQQ